MKSLQESSIELSELSEEQLTSSESRSSEKQAASLFASFSLVSERRSAKAVSSVKTNERGAVFVEHLIAFLPVLFFFLAVWQLMELFAAHLIVQRAASAAARAAVVVLPDDPQNYGGVAVNSYAGDRKGDIELAAQLVLANSPHFENNVSVQLSGATSGNGQLTARVEVPFRCQAAWVNIVCGGGSRMLRAEASHAYQGANFVY